MTFSYNHCYVCMFLLQIPLILAGFASAAELAVCRGFLVPSLDKEIESALTDIFTKRQFATLRHKEPRSPSHVDIQAERPCLVDDIQYAEWVPSAMQSVVTAWTRRLVRIAEDPSLTGVAVIGLHFAEASLHSAEPRFAIQDPHIDTYKKSVVTGILRFRFLDFHYLVFLCEDHL